jgi:hypothetical protein
MVCDTERHKYTFWALSKLCSGGRGGVGTASGCRRGIEITPEIVDFGCDFQGRWGTSLLHHSPGGGYITRPGGGTSLVCVIGVHNSSLRGGGTSLPRGGGTSLPGGGVHHSPGGGYIMPSSLFGVGFITSPLAPEFCVKLVFALSSALDPKIRVEFRVEAECCLWVRVGTSTLA